MFSWYNISITIQGTCVFVDLLAFSYLKSSVLEDRGLLEK
jgi:hypothetical protein